MRILYVSQYFPPEMGAPAARVWGLARAWVRAGHDVEVLTGFPNHPTGVIPEEYRGDLVRREEVDGVRVLRVPVFATPNRGVAKRGLAYVSFAASASTFGRLLARRPDVAIGTSPQILVGAAARAIAATFRVPFVLEVRDLWPDSIVAVRALDARNPVLVPLRALERWLYRAAELVVAASPAFVEPIIARGGRRDAVVTIENGADLDLFGNPGDREGLRARLGVRDKFVATYVGTIGMAHGIATVLEAATMLSARDDILFLLVGAGAEAEAISRRIEELRLRNVRFLGERPRAEIPDLLAASDVGLVMLRDSPLFRTVLPSKIFEMLAMARPIIIAVDGEARSLVETRARAGRFVPPEDPRALAAAVLELERSPSERAEMGARGREFVVANYERGELARRYVALLEKAIRR